jgi:hypothetical protein
VEDARYLGNAAWFVGHKGAAFYPEPQGDAVLTVHAEAIRAELAHRIETSNGLVVRAFDITVENAPLVESVDASTVDVSVNVMDLRKGVERENVSELTARVLAGDRDNLETISTVATNLYTGDEGAVVAKLDEWADFNDNKVRLPLPNPGDYPIPCDTCGPDYQTGAAHIDPHIGDASAAALAQAGQGVIASIIRLPGAIRRKWHGGSRSPL